MRTRFALAQSIVLSIAFASPALAAPTPPPRLSTDASIPSIDSSYGSGNFGSWHVDADQLPAFRYAIDQATDARAPQPELGGGRQAQHQLGNDHITAAAYNHGYTQLWSQDRLAQWANFYDEDSRHYAGGFGYLRVDDQIYSTLYLDRPQAGTFERDFGVGYYRKQLTIDQLTVEEITYAPFGDDPVLLDDVTITNHSASARTVSWFEYWDVSPFDRTGKVWRGVGDATWSASHATLAVTQSGGSLVDPAPLSLFAAALQGTHDGYETSLEAFFGSGTRAAPQAVAADALSNSLQPASNAGTPTASLFAFRAPLVLAPGQQVTLRYLYGLAHPDQIDGLVTAYRAKSDPRGDSASAWRAWVPKWDLGSDRRWVGRELVWDAYLLRSASVYEETCGHHTITQGGYYLYSLGLNLGFRSWLHYLLPITYTAPDLGREILRYAIGWQQQNGLRFPYGVGPMCQRQGLVDPEGGIESSDLDFWLLLGAAEYGLGSRDLAFFDEPIPFYDTHATASAWEHIKLAYQHQESIFGTHGGYRAGTNGDWSDFSTVFLKMTESTLVTAQLAYVYPQLAELAERRGDKTFAATVRRRARELKKVMRREWTGRGWYSRGYATDRQIGEGAIFGEPQPWAILAGVPSRKQATTLVGNIRRFLGGVDAPAIVNGPAVIGSSLTPAHNDPDVTERITPPVGVGNNNANYVGGVWFDVNGWLTWALSELDGRVDDARALAWDEYTRNTLANHATRFPDRWAGTISVDDACYAYYSNDPARCGIDLFRDYDGQITEQATWMVMNAIRLSGITPTRDGFRIAPHLTTSTFNLRLPYAGVAGADKLLHGYFRTRADGPVTLRVRLPKEARRGLAAWSNQRRVRSRRSGGDMIFTIDATADQPADWAVTWK